jgi:hypothetical protein
MAGFQITGIVGFCMATPRDKLEDFKHSGLSVVKPPLGMSFTPFATGIPTDAREIEKAIQDAPGIVARAKENEELMSHGSIAGVIAKGMNWERYNREIRERLKASGKSDSIDIAFLALLDEIERLSIEIAKLEEQIESLRAELVAEYGEDFLEDMAQMYLSEDELAAINALPPEEHEEAMLKALQDKMLDADGNLKPEYADTAIGQYVHAMRLRQNHIDDLDSKVDLADKYLASNGEIDLEQSDAMIGALVQKLDDNSSLSAEFGRSVDDTKDNEALLEVAMDNQAVDDLEKGQAADAASALAGFGMNG